jgi:hypothetical protein
MKLPKAEQHLEEWQAAAEALIPAATDRGKPILCPRRNNFFVPLMELQF